MTLPFKRWLRHLWLDAEDARRILTAEGLTRLEGHVRQSEARHRGELRLCVEGGLPLDALWRGTTPRQRAVELFSSLGVWDTEHNNGVLIYLLLADHRIEILADRGLSARVPTSVWQEMADQLAEALKAGHFEEGLRQAVNGVDALLRQHYPLVDTQPDSNEQPDAVVLI